MAEEDTVHIRAEQCFSSEEYGWIAAWYEYDVRAAVAEMWIADGRAKLWEKKSP
jgi:hypothetical protein